MTNKFLIPLLLLFAACYRVPDRIDPRVSYQLQDQHFQQLTGAFAPLTPEERASDWGKEYIIARAFAGELDLYRAVSTFKRAHILLTDNQDRKLEIEYDIVLCFFLGKRYDEAIESFEKSSLRGLSNLYCELTMEYNDHIRFLMAYFHKDLLSKF